MVDVIEGEADWVEVNMPENPDWLVDEMPNPNEYRPDWLEDMSDERLVLDSVRVPSSSSDDGRTS